MLTARAVSLIAAKGVTEPGAIPNTVVQVFQKGYVLNERLLRPSLVVVAADQA